MKHTSTLHLALVAMAGLLLAGAAALALPPGIDWRLTFRPAALAVWAGHSPYSVGIFGLAPWGILPFLPFALLPEALGRGLLFVISLAAFAYSAHRLGARPLALGVFLISPPVVNDLLNTNSSWLVLLGFSLPPQIGLFFVLVKPQVGAAVGLFWLVEAWRRGGWREVVRISWPATTALALSFLLFGLWPVRSLHVFESSQTWNASLWPVSLPVGLALLVAALRRREARWAMAASPCLSPYVLLHAWSGALIALVPDTLELLAAVVGLWALALIRAFPGP